ncbi:MAG: DUF3866 family protein [Thermoleophilaceae bacterium]|nr:DUF3866 family protein [Thermoleophilaceae bacterium]
MTRHQRLRLRRGRVAAVESHGAAAELRVEIEGEERRAISYEAMTGPARAGDDVIVNVAALDLGLGSGGFDVVHANLTRGLSGAGEEGAHVMKLNYSSLQHAVHPVEERSGALETPLGAPVAITALHGQLPCVAWQAGRMRPGARIGYVQTAGGALPGELSQTVAELRERDLLAGHVTAGAAFGGEHEAISTQGAIHAALTALGWDAVIAGPGPGILGSATALGHGGIAALDSAHAALTLGCETIVVPRMSDGDPRERHRGLSHHTRTVLDLLLAPVTHADPDVDEVDLDGYIDSGLPASTMGRGPAEDPLFFRAALAGGVALATALGPALGKATHGL